MDDEIEKQEGKSIKTIFDKEGEGKFRELETEYLKGIAGMENIILSTGGGVILKEENVDLLSELGTIVLLHATIDHIVNNIKSDEARQNRPLLQEEDYVGKIERLYAAREDKYLNAAHVIVKTSGRRVEDITAEIIARLDG
jgi:shikimate kinase